MIVVRYHDSTKHDFHRFARSIGYLDWSTQPDPFRRYEGAPLRQLPRAPLAAEVPYAALYGSGGPPRVVDDVSIGEFLRCSMGLSAWKQYGGSRWALRVNPSSGNLHPTEAWIVHAGRVCHYAPREHALEERCVLAGGPECRDEVEGFAQQTFLVALTSITWREAWKYGERAFRYCLHDTGHAIGAMRLAAAMLGWRMHLLHDWSDDQIAALLGLNREEYHGAEPDEPECIALVGRWDPEADASPALDAPALVEAAERGRWAGRPNRLSVDRVRWPVIDDVANATRYPGTADRGSRTRDAAAIKSETSRLMPSDDGSARLSARALIVQRRSALAFDRHGVLRREAFLAMLERLQPDAPPWDAIDWAPQVHLVLFVHRVEGLIPGIYAYVRDASVVDEWKSAMRADFLWEPVTPRQGEPTRPGAGEPGNLFLLVPIDAGRTANRLSCDQEIAEDGFFSLGMLARFDAPLRARGEWFYRRLFWECGLVGQVLYLEAEAVGARATGIGCYYDDPMHELLGLSGHAWQSLYHFSMGLPVHDTRLTTEPGYSWEHEDHGVEGAIPRDLGG